MTTTTLTHVPRVKKAIDAIPCIHNIAFYMIRLCMKYSTYGVNHSNELERNNFGEVTNYAEVYRVPCIEKRDHFALNVLLVFFCHSIFSTCMSPFQGLKSPRLLKLFNLDLLFYIDPMLKIH